MELAALWLTPLLDVARGTARLPLLILFCGKRRRFGDWPQRATGQVIVIRRREVSVPAPKCVYGRVCVSVYAEVCAECWLTSIVMQFGTQRLR